LTVTGVFQGVQMVYVPLMPGHDSRLPKKYASSSSSSSSHCSLNPVFMNHITPRTPRLRRLIGREKGQKYVDLIVTFENDDGSDVNGPPVRYWLTSKRKKVVKKSPQTPESS
jgi:ubiquitin-activating enzyme E1-like protein 2